MAHCANKWFVNARKICPACSSHKGGGQGPKARQGNPIWHRATSTFVRNKISQILSSQIYSRNSDHLVLLKKFQFVLTSFVFCTNQYNFGLSSVKVIKVENMRVATPGN